MLDQAARSDQFEAVGYCHVSRRSVRALLGGPVDSHFASLAVALKLAEISVAELHVGDGIC